MNLEKLFAAQKVLKDRIGYKGQDYFEKMMIALLVEVGECANEHREFKFWSKDQKPRVWKSRGPYLDIEDAEFYNPLLEEYVDGFHFVLEAGLFIDIDKTLFNDWEFPEAENPTELFLCVYEAAIQYGFADGSFQEHYIYLLNMYLRLGASLGFTWEEIEQAYFAKNQINHERQNNGY